MRHASRLAHGSIKHSRGVSFEGREERERGTMRDEMMMERWCYLCIMVKRASNRGSRISRELTQELRERLTMRRGTFEREVWRGERRKRVGFKVDSKQSEKSTKTEMVILI